ncbi:MAG: dihydroorotate dehydrogenase [Candidatus Burarchaeum sp.]|nr:dihydroorotate dehydrogenase [Candidatus Burarchaeum sp.]MDO8339265.1 dihydroorotate dehydrogenase [Candidatus Burarchaeum sp.]
MPSLETTLCGVRMKNPLVLASGIWGLTGGNLVRAAKEGAGAVTSKSCSLQARQGYGTPALLEWDNSVLNSMGLSNPGVDAMLDELRFAIKNAGAPVIASAFGNSYDDFGRMCERLASVKPALIEIDISSPNHKPGVKTDKPFACVPADAAKVTEVSKEACGKIPLCVKLSPNVSDISEVALAVEGAGADAICAINTLKAMMIDVDARRPILANKVGGLSGPAIFPVALRAVYEIRRTVEVPIIGTGGVTTGRDAVAMLMAGANAVGVGSALALREKAFVRIAKEIEIFMREKGVSKVSQLRLEE